MIHVPSVMRAVGMMHVPLTVTIEYDGGPWIPEFLRLSLAWFRREVSRG